MTKKKDGDKMKESFIEGKICEIISREKKSAYRRYYEEYRGDYDFWGEYRSSSNLYEGKEPELYTHEEWYDYTVRIKYCCLGQEYERIISRSTKEYLYTGMIIYITVDEKNPLDITWYKSKDAYDKEKEELDTEIKVVGVFVVLMMLYELYLFIKERFTGKKQK